MTAQSRLSPAQVVVLRCLDYRPTEALHRWDIGISTRRRVTYPTLLRLRDAGLLERVADMQGARWKITDLGRKRVAAHIAGGAR